ncbi:MAG: RNA-binding protein [Gammaproteobacteria bacterium]|nr:MAG: RNA-binding protein [Gammaproteobacteria bacterium]RLA54874.1 MAG: RNA-binding protein [Gammaproteobacteria bacterium]
MEKVRIDKWLWAARFFRTRALAKKAIDGGKVHVDGQRTKPSKEVKVGNSIVVRLGWDKKEVVVKELSDQRRGAPEAAKLYAETPESLARREQEKIERRANRLSRPLDSQKPNKKQRRQIHRFREDSTSSH